MKLTEQTGSGTGTRCQLSIYCSFVMCQQMHQPLCAQAAILARLDLILSHLTVKLRDFYSV